MWCGDPRIDQWIWKLAVLSKLFCRQKAHLCLRQVWAYFVKSHNNEAVIPRSCNSKYIYKSSKCALGMQILAGLPLYKICFCKAEPFQGVQRCLWEFWESNSQKWPYLLALSQRYEKDPAPIRDRTRTALVLPVQNFHRNTTKLAKAL